MITLTAINELHFNRWAVARCLVVAPKKVAEATWNAEAAQWDHLKHLRIIPVLGSAQKRIRALNTPAGRHLHHQPGERALVGGLLPQRLALRHGGAG